MLTSFVLGVFFFDLDQCSCIAVVVFVCWCVGVLVSSSSCVGVVVFV